MVVGHTENFGEMAKKNVRIDVWIIIVKQIATIDVTEGGQEKIVCLVIRIIYKLYINNYV